MAGLSTGPDGSRFASFYLNRKRRMFNLGQIDKRKAESIVGHVQELVSAAAINSAIKPATAAWLKDIDDGLEKKLVKVGLIVPRLRPDSPTMKLKPFIDGYITGRTDLKWRSKNNLEQARNWLVDFFGAERRIDTITPGDAIDEFAPWLKSKLSENTARMHCRRAKDFFCGSRPQKAACRKSV